MRWDEYERVTAEMLSARRRKARERRRQEITWSLIVMSLATAIGVLMLMLGVWAAPKGGGYFAIALTCWIAGGAYTLLFGGFLLGAIVSAVKFIRDGKRS